MNEKPFDFGEYLLNFLKENPPVPFKPHAWYNEAGDALEVWWSNDADYGEELKGHHTDKDGNPYSSMCLHRNMDNKTPVGVVVYSLKQVLKESGFKIVPIEEKD